MHFWVILMRFWTKFCHLPEIEPTNPKHKIQKFKIRLLASFCFNFGRAWSRYQILGPSSEGDIKNVFKKWNARGPSQP